MGPDGGSLPPHLQGLLLFHQLDISDLIAKLDNSKLFLPKLLLGLLHSPPLRHQLLLLAPPPSVSSKSHLGQFSLTLPNLLLGLPELTLQLIHIHLDPLHLARLLPQLPHQLPHPLPLP